MASRKPEAAAWRGRIPDLIRSRLPALYGKPLTDIEIRGIDIPHLFEPSKATES
jgi:hypothetical protein